MLLTIRGHVACHHAYVRVRGLQFNLKRSRRTSHVAMLQGVSQQPKQDTMHNLLMVVLPDSKAMQKCSHWPQHAAPQCRNEASDKLQG